MADLWCPQSLRHLHQIKTSYLSNFLPSSKNKIFKAKCTCNELGEHEGDDTGDQGMVLHKYAETLLET